MKKFNAILQLRRDNDYNYDKIKSTFIPANGELCLVDTSSNGLRAVCGDGSTRFGELDYLDIIIWGYYSNGEFFMDSSLTTPVKIHSKLRVYIDTPSNSMYLYNGSSFIKVDKNLPTASSAEAGIMKLYTTLGSNEDGTMTQKSITEALSKKAEVSVSNEILVFTLK